MRRFAFSFAVAALAALGACKQPSVTEEINNQEKSSAAERATTQSAAAAYLAKNKARPGVITTASGLQYEVLRKGDPNLPKPALGDQVSVMYEGALTTGAVFDSSYARGEPAQFMVGRVIPGWNEALQLMHPGDAYRLVIPPELGYGPMGQGEDIPPNSALVFKVELLGFARRDGSIVTAQAQPTAGAKP